MLVQVKTAKTIFVEVRPCYSVFDCLCQNKPG